MMIDIRLAAVDDATRMSELLCALAAEFIIHEFSEEGKAYFRHELSPARLAERIAGDYRFYLAEEGSILAGVAAVRGNSHLYFLFVAKPYQRQGLARRLWNRARRDSLSLERLQRFTVSASNYALPIYERLGFVRLGEPRAMHGIVYTPMQYVVFEEHNRMACE